MMREALIGGPRLENDLKSLVEARVGLFLRDAEAREFGVAVALADAEVEPPAREKVDGGSLLGEQNRIVPGQHDHGGAEAQRPGARGGPGQEIEARRNLPESGEVMLDDEDAVVAERLGLDDIVDPLAEPLRAVEIGAAALGQRAADI